MKVLLEMMDRNPRMQDRDRRNRIRKLLHYSKSQSDLAVTHQSRWKMLARKDLKQHMPMPGQHILTPRGGPASDSSAVLNGMAMDHGTAKYKSVRANLMARKFIARKGSQLHKKINKDYASVRSSHAKWSKDRKSASRTDWRSVMAGQATVRSKFRPSEPKVATIPHIYNMYGQP